MSESLRKGAISVVGALIVLMYLSPVPAGTTRVVAASGDPIPGTSDVFAAASRRYLFWARLNNQGQVSFSAPIANSTGPYARGIFQTDASTLVEIARSGGLAPDGVSQYGEVVSRGQNDSGQVLFVADFRSANGQFTGDTGLYLWNEDDASIMEVTRSRQMLPDGSGVIADWGIDWSALNNSGQVSMLVELWETSGGASDDRGIFMFDGTNFVEIIREGHSGPNGSIVQSISSSTPALNDRNQIAFGARFVGMANNALFRSDGATVTELVPRITDFDFDDSGQVAFFNNVLNDPNDPNSSQNVLFRADESELVEIARGGNSAPDVNGRFANLHLGVTPILNNAGQIVFSAGLGDSTGGLFRGDGIETTQIALEGQVAPGGNGYFDNFYSFLGGLNDCGQVAFTASLIGTTGGVSDDTGIFLWDDERGLLQIVRKGESLLGSTIAELDFNGLNDGGQIAFAFRLADGRGGMGFGPSPSHRHSR